ARRARPATEAHRQAGPRVRDGHAGRLPRRDHRRLRPLLRRRAVPRRGRRRRGDRLRRGRGGPRGAGRARARPPRGRRLVRQANGGLYVAVAGNIGAGKSTLTRILSERYHLAPVFEAVDENPYLADFYADMRRYAFHSDRKSTRLNSSHVKI